MSEADPRVVAWRLAADLARARGEGEAAAAVARAAALLSGAEVARVWMIDRDRGYRFSGAWPEEEGPPEAPPEGLARAVVFGAPAAAKAEQPFRSRLLVPLLAGPRPLGCVELLERERAAGPFSAGDAGGLADLVHAAHVSLESLREGVAREARHLDAVTRLTRLFDIGRSFAAALEMDDLVGVVVSRVEAALDPEAAYLWLLDESGRELSVAAASGPAAAAARRWRVRAGQGVAGRVAETGEAMLIDDPDEIPGMEERDDVRAGVAIRWVMAAPVVAEGGQLLGVLEVVNKREEEAPPEEGDLVLLREIAASAALALANARRLDAERRAADLGSLLAVAQSLGASLDPRKIAFTLVHKAATVIRYRRGAVGLFRGARFEVVAISGQTFVDEKMPEIRALRDVLEWAAGLDEGFYVVREDDGTIDADRPETREKFRAYFEASGSRSFLAVPLRDDEGRLGVFALEASEPYAFSGRGVESAGLLGTQATTAFRNAVLYEQIPMVRAFRPLARTQRRLMSLSWGRRAAWAGGTLLVAAALVLVPLPLRVSGEARILPHRRLPVTAEVDGRIAQVLVREGDAVEAGQVLAVLNDTDYRVGLGDARARFEVAAREHSRLRADGRTADAAVEGARLAGLRAGVDLWETRLERTRIRATVSGVVATPRVEELVGASLERGDVFCEVVDPGRQEVEIAVREADAGLVAVGMPVKVKLHAYPARSFRARVARIGVAATLEDEERVFLARARLEGDGVPLRPGMTGQARVNTGPASLLRIVLRRPARWVWGIVWGWLP